MKAKNKLCGAAGFETYYRGLFGERWRVLKQALLQPVNHYALTEGLLQPFYLDKASYFAACALPPLEEGTCLDMCAAPGGKTLVLLTQVFGAAVALQANELSLDRMRRLQTVLAEHINPTRLANVTVTHYDGAVMARYGREKYDRILLDAPCSSERHVLTDEKYLGQWTQARIKNLSIRQWALLSSAFLLLKEGGFLVYSTCALSHAENNDVIDKLLTKYPNAAVIEQEPFELCEFAKHGLMFLPDKTGYGPLYYSLIKKCPLESAASN